MGTTFLDGSGDIFHEQRIPSQGEEEQQPHRRYNEGSAWQFASSGDMGYPTLIAPVIMSDVFWETGGQEVTDGQKAEDGGEE